MSGEHADRVHGVDQSENEDRTVSPPRSETAPVRKYTVLKILAGMMAGLLLAAGLLIWRLYSGPVSLEFASDLIRESLIPETLPLAVETGTPVLTWHGWNALFDVTVPDVHVTGYESALELRTPEIRMLLSPSALLQGEVTPVRITLERPHITATAPGSTPQSVGRDVGETIVHDLAALASFVTAIQDRPDTASPLPRLEVRHGTIESPVDKDGSVVFEDVQATIVESDGLRDLTLVLATQARLGRERVGLDVTLVREARSGEVSGALNVRDLSTALTSRFWPAVTNRVDLSVPVDADVQFVIGADFSLVSASGSIDARNGSLDVRELGIEPVAFDRLRLSGDFDRATETVSVREIMMRGNPWQITGIGALQHVFDRPKLAFSATILDLPVDDVPRYWPAGLAANARTWFSKNLGDGLVSRTSVSFEGDFTASDTSSLRALRLEGNADFTGVTANYLRPMLPARAVEGRASFTLDTLEVDVFDGQVGDIDVSGSRLVLADLHRAVPAAEFDIATQGSLAEALEILDHDAFRLARRAGIAPSEVSGTGDGSIMFRFPLLQSLRLAQVEYSAKVRLTEVSIPDMAFGKSLSDAKIALALDHTGMRAEGEGELASQRVAFVVTDSLDTADATPRTSSFTGRVSGSALHELGWPDWIDVRGDTAVAAQVIEQPDGVILVDASMDMTDGQIAIPGLEINKPRDAPGQVDLKLRLLDGRLAEVRSGVIDLPSLTAKFSVDFDDRSGRFNHMDISRATLDGSDISGKVTAQADGSLHAAFSGNRFDITRFMRESDRTHWRPAFTADAHFRELLLPGLPPLGDATVIMRHDGAVIERADVTGMIGDKEITVAYAESDEDASLRIVAPDAGLFLRHLDLVESVKGGELTLVGRISGEGADRRADLQVTIDQFSMIEAPWLAHVLNAASLTGLVDSLLGHGIQFQRLDATIRREGPVLRVLDSLAYGPSLGVSATGTVRRDTNQVQLQGMVVPAYGLSRLIDQIPILGKILTGGKKEGLLAAEYILEGDADDPRVVINPLTALAPGFLRSLFSITGSSESGNETNAEAGSDR